MSTEKISQMTPIDVASITDLHEVSKQISPGVYETFSESNDQLIALLADSFVLLNGDQDIEGTKTFTGQINASVISYASDADPFILMNTDIIFNGNTFFTNLTPFNLVATDGTNNVMSLTYGSGNGAGAVVQRDDEGNFSAGVITADLDGQAATLADAPVSPYSPTLGDGTTNFTMDLQTGEYWDIAGKKTFSAQVDWSDKNGVTGKIIMSLPMAATTPLFGFIVMTYARGMPAGAFIMGNVDPTNHNIVFHKIVAGITSDLTAADLGASGALYIGGSYY